MSRNMLEQHTAKQFFEALAGGDGDVDRQREFVNHSAVLRQLCEDRESHGSVWLGRDRPVPPDDRRLPSQLCK
uniref:Uncharacterized protein n=1 Tax=Chromera velia CCMP2878 TaxID=1169474 RepID=A0A0G4I8S3_9ALVE|eukprot:Cvel_12021.t1-p1 / transcript=Cvel_12021.t1 / gene=Cvel_12021 / organism=Chromera_velia_CCMP2878 / gene_product=hypothetical protein / transcript_product=hypothetical protein / location=Cvel_scaffold772:3148-3677(+) / protein_length=72 / sequence_SO=supercontig / SO=protein_coding / is_pseudo=false